MAFKLLTFVCDRCDTEQEQYVTNNEYLAEDECSSCQALPDHLEYVIRSGTYDKHGSWSNWSILN